MIMTCELIKHAYHHRKSNFNNEEHRYGSDYEMINQHKQHGYASSWGPAGFKKTNHALAIMVSIGVCVCVYVCVYKGDKDVVLSIFFPPI